MKAIVGLSVLRERGEDTSIIEVSTGRPLFGQRRETNCQHALGGGMHDFTILVALWGGEEVVATTDNGDVVALPGQVHLRRDYEAAERELCR